MDDNSRKGCDGGFYERNVALELIEETEQEPPTKLAADVAIAGMDPLRFLESTDPIEVAVMWKIVDRYFTRLSELQESQAVKITNALGKAIK